MKSRVENLSLAYFLSLFLIELIAILFILVLEEFVFGITPNKFANNFEEINEDIVLLAILGIIFFPVFEEFLHRYYLDYRTKSLWISSLLLLLFFVADYNQLNPLQNAIHLSGFLFLMVILLLKKLYNYTNLKLLVWGSILFFGLFHLSTFERNTYEDNYFRVILLLMPQFIGGFFLAFIRLNYRFIYCILYHGFFNLVLLSMGIIAYKFFVF